MKDKVCEMETKWKDAVTKCTMKFDNVKRHRDAVMQRHNM